MSKPGPTTRASGDRCRTAWRRRPGPVQLFGLGLALAVSVGLTACGSSSSKTNTGNPGSNPPGTTAPTGGGVSY